MKSDLNHALRFLRYIDFSRVLPLRLLSQHMTERIRAANPLLRKNNFTLFLLGAILTGNLFAMRTTWAQESEDWMRDQEAATLLTRRCTLCHNSQEAESKLDLTTREAALQGGNSGPAVVPEDASNSLLWQRIEAAEMPPKGMLSDEQRELIRAWIERGARWPVEPLDPFRFSSEKRAGYDWWSLQPLADSELRYRPGAGKHPIDHFVDQRLEQAGLKRSPRAEGRALVRRLYVDLHGLPPTPAQVDEFLADARSDAYARLVDRLLAEPEYGQRWARHWLDVARYGESQGFERDKLRTNAWRYRDWVINAFNQDMPYDEFARWQIAGDVLNPGDAVSLIATGFLVAAPWDEVGQNQQSAAMKAVVRQDELEDLVSAVTQTFLGLTANCARCHDHKFDPIHQREYYQLAAALAGVRHGKATLPANSTLAGLSSRRFAYESRILDLNREIGQMDQQARTLVADGPSPTEFRQPQDAARPRDLPKVLQDAEQGGDPSLDILARESSKRARGERSEGDARIPALLAETSWHSRDQLQFELEQIHEHQKRLQDPSVYAVASATPHETHLLLRGNPATPTEVVAPGGIAAIQGVVAEFGLAEDASDAQRRVHLAEWITDPRNPLFARVIVNRIWHYHFGVGLVGTPNDFGFNGDRPSHPELIDWLAAELIRSGWSLKHLHRCILNSETYRQSSQFREDAAKVDEGNRWLWRMSPQRLDAETLRDALLQFSGDLDRSLGGPGFYEFSTHVHNSQFYEFKDPVGQIFQRRTIYRTWVRSSRSHFLDAFDCPDPSIKTPQRAITTTPLQALALLNNSFVLRMSDALARRAVTAQPDRVDDQIRFVFREVLGRPPSEDEFSMCVDFVHSHSLPALCRVLFNSNELLYVD